MTKKDKVSGKPEKNEEVVKLEAEVADLTNKLQRALADYQNLQRQTLQQVEAMRLSSLGNILKALMQVSDDLELAMQSKKIDTQGLKNISEKLQRIAQEEGCDVINPEEGEDFSSTTMEAISQIDFDKSNPDLAGKIAQTVSVGLVYEGRILKPAKVIIYRVPT